MPNLKDLLSDPSLGLVREVRPTQLHMAETIEDVIAKGGIYIVEAPVGCGKTYAYLTPALLAGKRVVVSTPKKGLQDQIIHKDAPALIEATGLTGKVKCVVLKGKSNYTCQRLAERDHIVPAEYHTFLRSSPYGDRSEYPGTPPPWFSRATAEGCIGPRCDHYAKCGYIRLRQDVAQPTTKVIIVNHHLLGADFSVGLGTLIGGVPEVLVIDEAHKFAEGVRAAFTREAAARSAAEVVTLVNDSGINIRSTAGLIAAWDQLFQLLPSKYKTETHERKAPVFDEPQAQVVLERLETLSAEIKKTLGTDESGESTLDPEFAIPLERARNKALHLVEALRAMQGYPYREGEEEDPERAALMNERIMDNTVLYAQQTTERGAPQYTVSAAPVDLGRLVSARLQKIPAVVVTSATLAIENRFDHLGPVYGVRPTKTDVLPTVFNYGKQGLLYLPEHITHVGRPKRDDADGAAAYDAYIEAITEECTALIRASGGNAFVLTTANDEMLRFAEGLRRRLPRQPIFMQNINQKGETVGDGDPQTVLKRYMETEGAVLLGSKSFWEGVDVQGEKLTLVIIPKLPFPLYGDPIVNARARRCGTDAFRRVTLVDMLIDLRQGAGRLIRSTADRGVVAILDNRVWTKRNYGPNVREALPFPPSARTSDREQVEWYLRRVKGHFDKRREAANAAADTSG